MRIKKERKRKKGSDRGNNLLFFFYLFVVKCVLVIRRKNKTQHKTLEKLPFLPFSFTPTGKFSQLYFKSSVPAATVSVRTKRFDGSRRLHRAYVVLLLFF